MPRHLAHRVIAAWRSGRRDETSRLIIGSTGSGKSEGELVDLVRLADPFNSSVVLLDGHGPLAFKAAGHWVRRGHETRLVYEPLDATDRVLCWDMLPRSAATSPAQRRIENAETRDELAQCFLAPRNLLTLADRPLTRDWTEAAIALCLAQPTSESLVSLLALFRVGTAEYERLLRSSTDANLVAKFRDLERIRYRNPVQYEAQTGAARRLLELVCTSEIVRLRCRPGPFDWLAALRDRKLIAFDGGGIRSRELKRTVFLLATLRVIHAVRWHFAETQEPLPVVLVLEEAGAMGLVTPFVLAALQELRKAGLSIHLLTQSSLDFGERDTLERLLANTPWQAWYQCLSPADQDLGARALVNATFDMHAVHFQRTRQMHEGVEPLTTESRGEAFDPHGEVTRRDARTGTAFLARYRETTDSFFQSPAVQEQQYRTALATLRIGERIVRDRTGVRRERVRRLRVWRPDRFSRESHAAIERVRQQPIYLPPDQPSPMELTRPQKDAAERMRERY